MRATALILTSLLATWAASDAFVSEVWVADRGDGTYANPVINAYLKRLPTDMVGVWDFDNPRCEAAPKDASAACVTASALLELCDYVEPEKGIAYRDAAERMLASLGSEKYKAGDDSPAFLLHSTGNHPAGTEIDASIIYADYYYLEALERLTKRQEER